MTSIGVRELRQRASEYLRRVEGGETIEVTDRGRPVALLVPVPTDTLAQLRASGRLRPASAHRLPDPIDPRPGVAPPSEILDDLRNDD
ncbi:MAG: type II toxin-antitoxin system Phd/YefM family antitoxin [Acidimicrobiales bacterium]